MGTGKTYQANQFMSQMIGRKKFIHFVPTHGVCEEVERAKKDLGINVIHIRGRNQKIDGIPVCFRLKEVEEVQKKYLASAEIICSSCDHNCENKNRNENADLCLYKLQFQEEDFDCILTVPHFLQSKTLQNKYRDIDYAIYDDGFDTSYCQSYSSEDFITLGECLLEMHRNGVFVEFNRENYGSVKRIVGEDGKVKYQPLDFIETIAEAIKKIGKIFQNQNYRMNLLMLKEDLIANNSSKESGSLIDKTIKSKIEGMLDLKEQIQIPSGRNNPTSILEKIAIKGELNRDFIVSKNPLIRDRFLWEIKIDSFLRDGTIVLRNQLDSDDLDEEDDSEKLNRREIEIKDQNQLTDLLFLVQMACAHLRPRRREEKNKLVESPSEILGLAGDLAEVLDNPPDFPIALLGKSVEDEKMEKRSMAELINITFERAWKNLYFRNQELDESERKPIPKVFLNRALELISQVAFAWISTDDLINVQMRWNENSELFDDRFTKCHLIKAKKSIILDATPDLEYYKLYFPNLKISEITAPFSNVLVNQFIDGKYGKWTLKSERTRLKVFEAVNQLLISELRSKIEEGEKVLLTGSKEFLREKDQRGKEKEKEKERKRFRKKKPKNLEEYLRKNNSLFEEKSEQFDFAHFNSMRSSNKFEDFNILIHIGEINPSFQHTADYIRTFYPREPILQMKDDSPIIRDEKIRQNFNPLVNSKKQTYEDWYYLDPRVSGFINKIRTDELIQLIGRIRPHTEKRKNVYLFNSREFPNIPTNYLTSINSLFSQQKNVLNQRMLAVFNTIAEKKSATIKEISEKIQIPEYSIRPIIRKLIDSNLIERTTNSRDALIRYSQIRKAKNDEQIDKLVQQAKTKEEQSLILKLRRSAWKLGRPPFVFELSPNGSNIFDVGDNEKLTELINLKLTQIEESYNYYRQNHQLPSLEEFNDLYHHLYKSFALGGGKKEDYELAINWLKNIVEDRNKESFRTWNNKKELLEDFIEQLISYFELNDSISQLKILKSLIYPILEEFGFDKYNIKKTIQKAVSYSDSENKDLTEIDIRKFAENYRLKDKLNILEMEKKNKTVSEKLRDFLKLISFVGILKHKIPFQESEGILLIKDWKELFDQIGETSLTDTKEEIYSKIKKLFSIEEGSNKKFRELFEETEKTQDFQKFNQTVIKENLAFNIEFINYIKQTFGDDLKTKSDFLQELNYENGASILFKLFVSGWTIPELILDLDLESWDIIEILKVITPEVFNLSEEEIIRLRRYLTKTKDRRKSREEIIREKKRIHEQLEKLSEFKPASFRDLLNNRKSLTIHQNIKNDLKEQLEELDLTLKRIDEEWIRQRIITLITEDLEKTKERTNFLNCTYDKYEDIASSERKIRRIISQDFKLDQTEIERLIDLESLLDVRDYRDFEELKDFFERDSFWLTIHYLFNIPEHWRNLDSNQLSEEIKYRWGYSDAQIEGMIQEIPYKKLLEKKRILEKDLGMEQSDFWFKEITQDQIDSFKSNNEINNPEILENLSLYQEIEKRVELWCLLDQISEEYSHNFAEWQDDPGRDWKELKSKCLSVLHLNENQFIRCQQKAIDKGNRNSALKRVYNRLCLLKKKIPWPFEGTREDKRKSIKIMIDKSKLAPVQDFFKILIVAPDVPEEVKFGLIHLIKGEITKTMVRNQQKIIDWLEGFNLSCPREWLKGEEVEVIIKKAEERIVSDKFDILRQTILKKWLRQRKEEEFIQKSSTKFKSDPIER